MWHKRNKMATFADVYKQIHQYTNSNEKRVERAPYNDWDKSGRMYIAPRFCNMVRVCPDQ